MVDAFRYIHIKSGIRPLQLDLLQQSVPFLQLLLQPPPAIPGGVVALPPLLVQVSGHVGGDEGKDLVPSLGSGQEVLFLQKSGEVLVNDLEG